MVRREIGNIHLTSFKILKERVRAILHIDIPLLYKSCTRVVIIGITNQGNFLIIHPCKSESSATHNVIICPVRRKVLCPHRIFSIRIGIRIILNNFFPICEILIYKAWKRLQSQGICKGRIRHLLLFLSVLIAHSMRAPAHN